MAEYVDADPLEKRRKVLAEMGLRYDKALLSYVTLGGTAVLTKKKWFEMSAKERQDFVRNWRLSNKKEETWRDRKPLL